MTVHSADPWALLLLAPMAALVASTIFTLTSAVSAARSRRRVCAVLVSASVAGFGVWTINFFQAPRFDGGAWLLLPLGVAIAGQTCALLFTARSEPDTTSTVGSAFSLAAGAEATRFAMLDTLTTQGGLREWAWTGGGFAFAFAAYFAALSIWVNPRRNSSPWAGSLRCLAVFWAPPRS
jgi:NO-binding membrane sensor protein with MHYT domain